MGFWRKALISVAVLGAWAGVGSALFVLVTPGEERVQAMLKEMAGQDFRSREEAARTKQLVMAALQEAAATQENVTWRKNWQVGGDGGKSA
ncbi:ubiquinol-cytochrome-c reductase complex assembly factor 3 [Pipistrellus kuhlii]|uniref:Ubiquinol-cytochrome-c reductase complex assembly factor 3 n=1 Tax=Pipistrellus kuhlii TaxID=59472 RepID=A0A7J7RTW1_PIPKU|nr:ubiquinol-cytochrome-c reductase complex assembly factor 3 [Pipistrellus kuhlii]XP_045430072.1 ubiquinol-cytochrome-c reductase complex assembly factor 3 [Pipistrellus kuhlii]XP_045430073.1 ubiquinol-cytochrome-c reductase complex assembly factor 3 [Pipistrellus kuhlii]KAF6279580.1 ubiquinol-cytochrome c reductase complex assembly factor 3 [Pipistrellus kuhlii]